MAGAGEPPLRPRQRVAPGTPAPELERLALQEQTHPGASPLAIQSLIWLFRAYSAASHALASELHPLGLSPSAFNVLQALVNTPSQELEPCQLAERLLVSRPSVTGLIDTLQAKSLVERRRHPDDRRRVLVGLTPEALQALAAHYPRHYECLREVFAGLSEDEQATLVQLLRKVSGATPETLRDEPA